MEQAIVAEEMALANVPGALNSLGLGIVGPTLIVHGTEEQKRRHLQRILTAEDIWCQLYSEPDSGSDLASLKTTAVREDFSDGEYYVVNGQKVWTSRAEHSDLMLLLARTTPREQTKKRTEGLSVFLVDMRKALGHGLTIRPIRTMMNHNSTEVFFDNMEVPADNLIGEEGRGFRYILSGMNA